MARLVGIDIGDDIIRMAVVRTAMRRTGVELLKEIRFERGGEAAALAELGVAIGPKPDGIAVSLPGEKTFYRRLELPQTAIREIDSVVAFEIESSLPFEIESAVFAQRLQKRVAASDMLYVFAAVARLDDVKHRISLVEKALSREPEVVSPGSLPLANLTALIPELETGLVKVAPPAVGVAGEVIPIPTTTRSVTAPVAILDLAETRSELLVLVGGEPTFARTIARGTRGLPASAAALGRELKQSLSAWRAQGGDPVSVLYLAGSGAALGGAEAYLSSAVGVEVLRLPMPALEGVKPEEQESVPLYAKALSLALSLGTSSKALNLRQGPLATTRSFPFLREKTPLLSGLAAVIVVSFGFSVIAELRALSAERAALDTELGQVTKEVWGEETTDIARARELLEKGAPAGEEDPYPNADAFDVMVQYSKAVPKDVVHDVVEFDVTKGHATIQATIPKTADAGATTDKIMAVLREHPCLKDVKIQKTVQLGEDKQKYILELDVRCEEKKDPKEKKKDDQKGAAE